MGREGPGQQELVPAGSSGRLTARISEFGASGVSSRLPSGSQLIRGPPPLPPLLPEPFLLRLGAGSSIVACHAAAAAKDAFRFPSGSG